MSSKGNVQQQQGRRTPLSLAGGKNNHHQQNHNNSNKGGPKDSITNKNNNQSMKNQQQQQQQLETRNQNAAQKELKKNQQNGVKQDAASEDSGDSIIFVEENGKSNGNGNGSQPTTTTNGAASNKNNGSAAAKAANSQSNGGKDGKDEKEQPAKPEAKSNNKKGSDASAGSVAKKQNDANEKQTTIPLSPSSNQNKKDGQSTAKTTTPTTATSSPNTGKKSNSQSATPVKPNSASPVSNAQQKIITPTKSESLEKIEKPTTATNDEIASNNAKEAATPSKSSKVVEKTVENVEEPTNDNDMESLSIESSPPKKSKEKHVDIAAPKATSTPGKALITSNKHQSSEIRLTIEDSKIPIRSSVDRKSVPRSYSDISGRRSIRISGDFTPPKYNSQFRESYRRINTELDVSNHAANNTSMNVTVGSEVPNDSSFFSFSLFGRGRKRERTPPTTTAFGQEKSQSAVELNMEATTPPKRARLDVSGIFSVMSSPITMLRTRFSKATLETPAKDKANSETTTNDDVQNVSGVLIEEVVATEDEAVDLEKTPKKDTSSHKGKDEHDDGEKLQQNSSDASKTTMYMDVDGDIKITETPIIPAVGEPKLKQKGCLIM